MLFDKCGDLVFLVTVIQESVFDLDASFGSLNRFACVLPKENTLSGGNADYLFANGDHFSGRLGFLFDVRGCDDAEFILLVSFKVYRSDGKAP